MKWKYAWARQISLEKEQSSTIKELWPDGHEFTKIFNEFITAQEEFVDNAMRWGDFIRTRLDTNNKKSMEENQKFLLKNRVLASRFDSLLKIAIDVLRKETGLNMMDYSHPR